MRKSSLAKWSPNPNVLIENETVSFIGFGHQTYLVPQTRPILLKWVRTMRKLTHALLPFLYCFLFRL